MANFFPGASRRVGLLKDKSKIKAPSGGCISRDRNCAETCKAGARKSSKKRGEALSEQYAGEEKRGNGAPSRGTPRGLPRMPFHPVSCLPLANVENCWRFPEGLSYPARAQSAVSSASSPRDKFLTVKHLSPYRHMLQLVSRTISRHSFSKKTKTKGPTGGQKILVDPSGIRRALIRALCSLLYLSTEVQSLEEKSFQTSL